MIMKKILYVLLVCVMFCACNEYADQIGYKEDFVTELCGDWSMHTHEKNEGIITFTYDMQIQMVSENGEISIADYNLLVDENGNTIENAIVITYAENENREEILTDEDYENGGLICYFQPLDKNSSFVIGLPYYRTTKILLIKNN